MGNLAKSLGTSRTNLYRWVGDKDRLTSEVLWSLANDTLAQACNRAVPGGANYIAEILDWFMRSVSYHPSMRHFLERDPGYALRLLTAQDSLVRVRITRAVEELLEEQVRNAKLEPVLDIKSLAYLIVRVMESFMYSDLISGTQPDTAVATIAIRILLNSQLPPATQPNGP